MNDQDVFDALLRRAEGVARDVSGDFPETDTAFDLYVEELNGTLFGVIDMGDAYHEVFEWRDGEWDHAVVPDGQLATNYAFVIEDRILAQRRSSGY